MFELQVGYKLHHFALYREQAYAATKLFTSVPFRLNDSVLVIIATNSNFEH